MTTEADVWVSELAAQIDASATMKRTLSWSGQTVDCTVSPVVRTDDVGEMGTLNISALSACALLDDFTDSTSPAVLDVVEIIETGDSTGIKYHITQVENDGVAVTFELRRV